MAGWTGRVRAPLGGISFAALAIAAGLSGANAQTTLEPITVVATKTEEKVIDSLAAVSAVRQEQIDQLGPSKLSEIFFGMPGVTFQERGDSPATAINIRGLQDFGRVAVVVDGARQNFQTTGHNANGVFFLDPELIGGAEAEFRDYALAYAVLAISFVLEGISFFQATRQLRSEAHRFDRDLLEHALRTSDPTTRAVFAEDAAALIGLVIAAAGITMHILTGVAAWDAAGSILVGVLLAVVAVVLIDRNGRFLTGEPASTFLYNAAMQQIQQLPEVESVRYLRLEYVGPKQVFLVGSVDLVGDRAESSVAKTLRRLEDKLQTDPFVVKAVLTVSEPDDVD